MVSALFSAYGAGGVGHHVVLLRGTASPVVDTKFAGSWLSSTLGAIGSGEWYLMGDGLGNGLYSAALLDTDTDPPDQGGDNEFGIPSTSGASLTLPLADGRFVVASGSYLYVQRPDDTTYASRLFLSNLTSGGTHNVVAMSLVGTTARVMYATRGNATRSVRVVTLDLSVAPSGTLDVTTLPTYGSTIPGNAPWQDDAAASYNWYTGLIPNVMGAFEYCVFRNADRTNDGVVYPMLGVAIGAPYSSGGMAMSGYQTQINEFGSDTSFRTAEFTGGMVGSNLSSQSQLFGDVTNMSTVVAASGLSTFDYYFDAYWCAIQLSFLPPPEPTQFWTNLRLATETI